MPKGTPLLSKQERGVVRLVAEGFDKPRDRPAAESKRKYSAKTIVFRIFLDKVRNVQPGRARALCRSIKNCEIAF